MNSYITGDGTNARINFELVNASSVVVDNIVWSTGDGDTITMGLSPTRYDDGVYTLKMSGINKGIPSNRDITYLVIDTTAPVIAISNVFTKSIDGNYTIDYDITEVNFESVVVDAIDGSGGVKTFTDTDASTGKTKQTGKIKLILDKDVVYTISMTARDVKGTAKVLTIGSITGPDVTPYLVSSIRTNSRTDTEITIDYDLVYIKEDSLFTAKLFTDVNSDPSNVISLQSRNGTVKFDNLQPNTSYTLVYISYGPSYTTPLELYQTFNTTFTPTISFEPVIDMSSHEQFTTTYDYDHVVGDGVVFTAYLYEIGYESPADFKELSTPSGTLTFTNLEPGVSYKIVYIATGNAYSVPLSFNDQLFTTLYNPALEMDGVEGLLTETSNTFIYKFQNVAGNNNYTAELRSSTGTEVIQTVTLSNSGTVKFDQLVSKTVYIVKIKLDGPLYIQPVTFDRSFTTLAYGFEQNEPYLSIKTFETASPFAAMVQLIDGADPFGVDTQLTKLVNNFENKIHRMTITSGLVFEANKEYTMSVYTTLNTALTGRLLPFIRMSGILMSTMDIRTQSLINIPLKNGWYRLIRKFTPTSNVTFSIDLGASPNGTTNYGGNNVDGPVFWGLEIYS